ncbi:peptidase M13 [Hymenobacter sp. PAMC 26628]|nr:peptidase M13 [Hymenobacter sp. PAMC 26628]
MDRSVKPGDDFYAFANGTWQKNTEIPATHGSYGMFNKLQELSFSRIRSILEDAETHAGSQLGDFYASFLDEATTDRKGLAPLKPWMEQIAAAKDKSALAATTAALQRQGIRTIFDLPGPLQQPVSPDDKQPQVEVFHLLQGGLGLPSRDYYLKNDAALVLARSAYVTYLTRLLELAGQANAATRAQAVLAFEQKIAQVHWTGVDSRDVNKSYNRWTSADFVAKAPGFDWPSYLAGLGLSKQAMFIVGQPSAFTGEARAWTAASLAVLQDHLLLHLLDKYAPYLSKPFVDAHFAFRGTALTGTLQNQARWERGVDLVTLQMRDAVGQRYVAKFFPPETKAVADRIIRTVVAAWRERLKSIAWMSPATREKARAKLAAMLPLVGYTSHWRNYATLRVVRGDLVGNVQRAYAFEFQYQLSKLTAPTNRDDWDMTPMRVDAEEDPVRNIITIPAAILQPPYFDPKADLAVNYGGIGAFIGHEISHLFDDQGRKYDPAGKLTDWWTPADVARFTVLTDQLIKQYDAYEPITGQHIQGGLTLGENMADLAGITVGHQAYRMALGGKAAPLLDGFTGEQRFYLGWAQIWRVKYRESALRAQLLSDPHPPGQQRVAEVRNRSDWYKAFSVQAGQQLYLPASERVQIW